MKKLFLISLIFISLITLTFVFTEKSFAAGGTVSLQGASPVQGLTGTSGIATLVGRIIKFALGVIGAIALLMFVYGGFLMLASGGKTDQINKGKEVLIWAVIGLAVMLGSYTLTDFVIKAITTSGTLGGGGGGTPGGGSTTTTCVGLHPGNFQCKSQNDDCTKIGTDWAQDSNATSCGSTPTDICCYNTSSGAGGPSSQSSKKCKSGDTCSTGCTSATSCTDPNCALKTYYQADSSFLGTDCSAVCCATP